MSVRALVGAGDASLDQRLSDELLAGTSGWTRGIAAGIVTSFTFQAPGFYERHGYREFARWEGLPVAGEADVHLRKDLAAPGQ